jgi:hypothetical protein
VDPTVTIGDDVRMEQTYKRVLVVDDNHDVRYPALGPAHQCWLQGLCGDEWVGETFSIGGTTLAPTVSACLPLLSVGLTLISPNGNSLVKKVWILPDRSLCVE